MGTLMPLLCFSMIAVTYGIRCHVGSRDERLNGTIVGRNGPCQGDPCLLDCPSANDLCYVLRVPYVGGVVSQVGCAPGCPPQTSRTSVACCSTSGCNSEEVLALPTKGSVVTVVLAVVAVVVCLILLAVMVWRLCLHLDAWRTYRAEGRTEPKEVQGGSEGEETVV